MALRKRGIGGKSGRAQFAVGSGQRTKLKGSKVKRKVNMNRANESIWDIDQAAGAQEGLLNPVAVEILCRGIKGIEPLIPPWAEGVEMPISDIALAFERYFNLWDEAAIEYTASPQERKKERALVAQMRSRVRELLMPLDGGLVRLSNTAST
jgi:hypothetical protein